MHACMHALPSRYAGITGRFAVCVCVCVRIENKVQEAVPARREVHKATDRIGSLGERAWQGRMDEPYPFGIMIKWKTSNTPIYVSHHNLR